MNYLMMASVDVSKLLIILGIVAILAVLFAALIVLVSKLCAVEKNETAEKIQELLAGANCGGCGYAGCADFAKALAEGRAEVKSCGPTPNENKATIAEILGQPFAAEEKKVAAVHCAGGAISLDKYKYVGNEGCVIQSTFMGGKKVCPQGCLGGGTCESKCPYHAIAVKNGVAVVDNSLCEACGLCVNSCPKHIIDYVPVSAKVYVACSTTCRGKEVMTTCKSGCIGCGLCAKNCPEHAITMVDNLPVIDYSKCSGCKTCVLKCPRKCIKEFL